MYTFEHSQRATCSYGFFSRPPGGQDRNYKTKGDYNCTEGTNDTSLSLMMMMMMMMVMVMMMMMMMMHVCVVCMIL